MQTYTLFTGLDLRVQVGNVQCAGLFPGAAGRVTEQQPERVAVAGDGVPGRVALRDEPAGVKDGPVVMQAGDRGRAFPRCLEAERVLVRGLALLSGRRRSTAPLFGPDGS